LLDDISEHARRLHQQAIVIDAHSDILAAVADGRAKLAERAVVAEGHTRDALGHYDLPRWLEGGMTAQVCTIYIARHLLHHSVIRGLDIAAAAYAEVASNDQLVLAKTTAEIRQAKQDGKVAMVLSFEGVDALGGTLDYLPLYHALGVRMASLTHARRNFYSGGVERGVDERAGLSTLGREAIRKFDELGIVVDLRHMDARAIFEAMEITRNPVVMSHINARLAFPEDPDDAPHHPFSADKGVDRIGMLRKIGESGGVVCIIFWKQGTVDNIVDDIVYVADHIGIDHVGLGTDLYGFDAAPVGAEDVSCFPRITDRLLKRGFSDDEVLRVLGGNLMRVFDQVWK
jgi:membrane dipeptidase